ncbi:YIP1 family protein [Aromatoleum aromaticum]|uniref:YIP1 family protein n=1 Tax=Aromatoleum aromaticum TaxID=551760 RepID=UPI0014595B5F|nr:YIP1 family protein [Aromatoleum aromaticum]NMG55921.1 DUF1282 domain-containing protein [Aromatoleum aromaticum]
MNLMQYPMMLFSTHGGWDDVQRRHPSQRKVFLMLVLPLSILPPVMILQAASGVGATVFPGAPFGAWIVGALLFFIAEQISVPLMTGVIRRGCVAKGASGDLGGAYTVAAIAPVPLWLSSLALLAGEIWVVVLIAFAALLASGVLIHHGVERLLGVEEDVNASDVAVQVISLGVLAWGALVLVAATPLLLS